MSNFKQAAYAAINLNQEIRLKSSSGGIFSLLAEEIIKQGGVVFGGKFDESFNVVHSYVDNIDDLDVFRGSKYVESRTGDTYSKVKLFLEEDRKVLFTGTPCQIAGLNSFLGKKYDNLYMQDLICHGAPMAKVWNKYLEYRKDIDNNRLLHVSFRDKANGWKDYEMKFNYSAFTSAISHHDDLFMKLFLSNYSLRESCYACKFKGLDKISDITLADFWGIRHICEEMYDNKGTSLVILNSLKGKELFDLINSKVEKREVDLNEAIKYNLSIIESALKPVNRTEFLDDLDKLKFDELANKYIGE